MANNFNTNLPTTDGVDFASNDIAGVHYPYVKLVFGIDGTATLVSSSNPVPTVQTGALPAGTNNIGDVDVLTMPAITGTVTANAGTGTFVVGDGGGSLTVDATSLPLPTGASTLSEQQTQTTALQLIDDTVHAMNAVFSKAIAIGGQLDDGTTTVATENNIAPVRINAQRAMHTELHRGDGVALIGQTTMSNSLPVAIASDQSSIAVGDGGGSLTIDNATLSVTGGGTEATSLRVTLANDSTGLVSVDDNGGSLTIDNAALATTGNGTAAGSLRVTVASDSTGVIAATCSQATAANLNAEVQGDAAHDAAAAGNPVLIGLRANTSEPATAVADGDSTYAWGDKWGRIVVTDNHPPKLAGSADGPVQVNSTASGDVQLIAAPGASTSLVVTGFWISNQGTAKNRVALREGAAGTIRYRGTLAADGGGVVRGPIKWVLPANTALTINIGTAGDIDASIDFFTQATP